jgi:hypothetical protein
MGGFVYHSNVALCKSIVLYLYCYSYCVCRDIGHTYIVTRTTLPGTIINPLQPNKLVQVTNKRKVRAHESTKRPASICILHKISNHTQCTQLIEIPTESSANQHNYIPHNDGIISRHSVPFPHARTKQTISQSEMCVCVCIYI